MDFFTSDVTPKKLLSVNIVNILAFLQIEDLFLIRFFTFAFVQKVKISTPKKKKKERRSNAIRRGFTNVVTFVRGLFEPSSVSFSICCKCVFRFILHYFSSKSFVCYIMIVILSFFQTIFLRLASWFCARFFLTVS